MLEMPGIKRIKERSLPSPAAAVEVYEDDTEVEDEVPEDTLDEELKAELEKPIHM